MYGHKIAQSKNKNGRQKTPQQKKQGDNLEKAKNVRLEVFLNS